MDFLRRNGLFLTLCTLLIVALSVALVCVPKAELHLLLCSPHTHTRDTLFRYYTQIGEWVPYLVCVALLFYKTGAAVFTLAGTLLSGLATQIIKRIVDAPRPLTYFAENYPDTVLPLVDGVEMSRFYSFPSGHTTTFFALFFALCIIGTDLLRLRFANQSNNKPKYYALTAIWQIVCFALAALGGYSRIYLSQHFAADVLGGMCVGLLITGLLYIVFHRWQYRNWYKWHFFPKKSL